MSRKLTLTLLLALVAIALWQTGQTAFAAPTTDIAGGTISADTTWALADSPFDVLDTVTVSNGATLTIEAGVELNFDGTSLALIISDGALVANGTMTDTIVFGSSGQTAGDWRGIEVGSSGSAEISHCDIAYAGSSASLGSVRLRSSNTNISNCTIRDGASAGVLIESTALTPSLSNVAINGHTAEAVRQAAITAQPSYTDLTVDANGTDAINIPGGSIASELQLDPAGIITGSTRATGDTIPYRFSGNIIILAGGSVTATSGTEIRLNNSNHFVDVRSGGRFVVSGTMTNPVTFQSDSGTAGSWYGIYARSGSQVNMAHCKLSGAGSTANGSLYLAITDATVEHCTIRDGNDDGIVLAGAGIAPTLRNVAILNNAGTAVRQTTANMTPTYDRLTVGDNGIDAIDVSLGSLSRDITWAPAGVVTTTARTTGAVIPYRVGGNIVILDNAALTIADGNDIRINNSNHFFDLRNGGQLTVSGTVTDPVTFRSDGGTAGSWYGIYARSGSQLSMAHCDLLGAGSTANGSLYVATTDASIESCTIRNGDSHGIVLSGSGIAPTLRNVSIISNTEAAISQSTVNMVPVYDGLIVAGNGIDAINAGSGSIGSDITLSPAGIVSSTARSDGDVIPYRFGGTVTILAGGTLSVTDEADLRFNNTGHFLDVRSGGALRLIGSTDSVRLSSDGQTAGDWYGVYIRAGASATLAGCSIGYAGSTTNGGLYIESSDVSVTECGIHDNANAGIVVASNAQPTLDCNFIEGNAAGLINRTPATEVDATNNWWGDASGPTHASNPTGTGDSVSDGVLFDPWKAAPTAVTLVGGGVSAEIPHTPYFAYFATALITAGLLRSRCQRTEK